jgi:hypothetical protein
MGVGGGGVLHDLDHRNRVDRVLCFFSSRSNWDSPTASPVPCPLPLWFRRGAGDPNSDEGTDTVVVLLLYMYFVVLKMRRGHFWAFSVCLLL